MLSRALSASTIPILMAVLLGGCQNRSATAVDDSAIVQDVKARLTAEFGSIERREARQMERGATRQVVNYIEVTSREGNVALSGEVRSNRAKAKADQIARSVPHVRGVTNQLAVSPGYSDDAVGTGAR